MKDFERYKSELFNKTKCFESNLALMHYRLPKSNKLHSMICGVEFEFKDNDLYARAESIDYFMYEKEIWNLDKPE